MMQTYNTALTSRIVTLETENTTLATAGTNLTAQATSLANPVGGDAAGGAAKPRQRRKEAIFLLIALLLIEAFSHSLQVRIAGNVKLNTIRNCVSPISDDDRFKALILHEKGEWHHVYYFDSINRSNITYLYTPRELDWILYGRNQPTGKGACKQYRDALMYTSNLGNQCGCKILGFRPSHSVWITANSYITTKNIGGNTGDSSTLNDAVISSPPTFCPRGEDNDHSSPFIISPSLKLVEKLAKENHTLCFMGDSIDLQF